ncbi:serine/threonine-protein kinase Vps15p [[Candida] jaroonii]|uniref:Serine/threonine-protein kinase Vps15p n=1 Tax=[Candida] jaroonii TaxID=467808 RepID=A0ACA9YEU8_9ASCO|nr:serine/threonine-protein kinase Vps15p [[Candida] jaroonii]
MGPRLSLLAPSAPTIGISSYVDILENVQYIELINNSRFLKTIKAIDLNNGDAIIIKILIKPNSINGYNINLQNITELMVKEATLLSQYNFVLPFENFIETERAGYLIRQSIKINLYDRLSIRPFLEPIEKKFIVYQLLKILDTLHNELKIYHGDLKLENLMVSSSNWIMLTDFSNFSKPIYIPEDNPNQFSFYFDTSDRRVCNLAPERFYNSSEGLSYPKSENFDDNGNFNGINQLTDSMDLFSLGCIIGELYSDGEPLFTLSALFKYMKNEYLPDLSGIDNMYIKEIIMKLISFDPQERIKSNEILNNYKNVLFPNSFYTFLYDFIKTLNSRTLFQVKNDKHVTSSDLRIDYIYSKFDKIITGLDFQEEFGDKVGLYLNLPGMPKNYQIRRSSSSQKTDDSSLIILNFIFSLISTLKQPSSKIKACELIVALSGRINDECKLDRSLPYLCTLIDEFITSTSRRFQEETDETEEADSFSSRVVVVALDSIVTLLDSCSYITPLNVLMFPEYLIPKLSKLVNAESVKRGRELVKIKVASVLPKLAQISHRFWMMSKNFKNKQSLNDKNNFNIPLESMFNDFEDLTISLLTDSNPNIKCSLVQNIEPLCRFFGIEKTNDIILPHLITYLNDVNNELKLGFLNSILKIGPFMGILSFEQYLLPLLIQTLSDSEQLVVLKVLEIFVEFVKTKLINPISEFNALSIYKELLSNTVHLFLHPNEWIRQSVLCLVLAINGNLSNADRFCFLYPQFKKYLSYDISEISWDNLYPCLTRPLSKVVFQLLITWCSQNSDKSIFWKQQNFIMSPKKLTNFTKDLGKSVFISKYSDPSSMTMNNSSNLPLSHDDKQWLLKLKAVGLEDKDSWKIYNLRDYIVQLTRGFIKEIEGSLDDIKVDVTPRNIFFEIHYKSENIATAARGLETNIEQEMDAESIANILSHNDQNGSNGHDKIQFKSERSGSNSLILPNITKISASIQTVEETVFGELDNDPHKHHNHDNVSGSGYNHKVISSANGKVIISNSKYSYNGSNPYILQYLEKVDFDLSLDSFREFGRPVKFHTSKTSDWVPTNTCISRINTNTTGDDQIDSLNCLAVNPSSEFFITGSDSGAIKIWDTSRLEKNIMFKHPSLVTHLKSPIEKIVFMKNRNVFAVSCKNGKIYLFRVDFTRGKNKRIVKYLRLQIIRKYQLTDEFATSISFHIDESKTWLICTTTRSKIIAFNIITMECDFILQNPLINGIPTSLIIDHRGWLIVGTNKGRLSLWDTRFSIIIKTWKIVSNDGIKSNCINQLVLLPPDYKLSDNNSTISYFAVICNNMPDITIWELPNLECREILCHHDSNPKIKQYSIEYCRNELDDILKELNLDLESDFTKSEKTDSQVNNSILLFKHISGNYLINSFENRVILWKIDELENSISKNFSFSRILLNQRLGLTSEKLKTPFKNNENSLVNDIAIVSVPYEMVITVDKSGFINIFT